MQELEEIGDHPVRAEIFRATRLCVPALDRIGLITYEGNPTDAASRELWCASVVARHLLPAIEAAHLAASRLGVRELLAADLALDGGLCKLIAERSRAAGRVVAGDFRPPSRERTLGRYLAAVENGETSGHLAVVLAARASVFHISPALAVSALVFLEMRSAPVSEFWPCVESCLRSLPSSVSLLRAA